MDLKAKALLVEAQILFKMQVLDIMLPICYLAMEHCKNDVNKHHAIKYQNWLWKQRMRMGQCVSTREW